ncbi:MAG: branched-chain amino acid ABC transporter permease [Deltaproteobacteria bacterium]|nr:branched-chain amino acid ABC transporter permease [Deltaproteobacteria bacterium]
MEILMFGLTLSLMYALIASGFALILGTSRIFDLCFGSYYLVSAYLFAVLAPILGSFTALVVTIPLAGGMAWPIHRYLLYPFRETPIVVMVLSCAVAIAVGEIITLIFGTEFKYVAPLWEGSIEIVGATLSCQRLLAGGVALIVFTLLWLYLKKTKQGLAIQALIQGTEIAGLVGINPKKIQLIVACIGGGLAALSSILVVPVFCLTPFIWFDAILLSFAGVVVGGLGSIWGALMAMGIIAFSETLVSFFIPNGGFFRQAVYVMIMIIVLLVRPYGLFGKRGEA